MKDKPTCPCCGGHNITADAVCTWNMAKQAWEYQKTLDSFYCMTCEEPLKFVEWAPVEQV